MSLVTGGLVASGQSTAKAELTKLKREYADVLALQGTAKGEIVAIAKLLRANPKMAVVCSKLGANLLRGLDLQPNSTFCFK